MYTYEMKTPTPPPPPPLFPFRRITLPDSQVEKDKEDDVNPGNKDNGSGN